MNEDANKINSEDIDENNKSSDMSQAQEIAQIVATTMAKYLSSFNKGVVTGEVSEIIDKLEKRL